ncbi:armadillo-type protein [Lophiotrema nucula]|uniref:Armadillo-type protein n=1 Tax=Lophiotrema nucula TaxID=690887 RepID=A0A6A5ZNJ6_9PLEO|nr:armadillo-type protein [Lophiotrema nucula]
MAGVKRKSATSAPAETKVKSKKPKVEKTQSKRAAKDETTTRREKPAKKAKVEPESDLEESDTSEVENGFYGFSANKKGALSSSDEDQLDADDNLSSSGDEEAHGTKARGKRGLSHSVVKKDSRKQNGTPEEQAPSRLEALNATSSREAHAKQKALAKERKAAKPNADIIERSKKLWEKLRLKSHVEKDERKKLVKELFEIITDRVKDFVFKHDSVRVIQCAIKYATLEQRRIIARELKGDFRTLAEGKYSKFLIAKLLEKNDPEIRDLIISEFQGHVKRLINHPEASWILDDTYRAVATQEQKTRLLREWYGPEFSIAGLKSQGSVTAELSEILQESPEKRKPILDHLKTQINTIIQKKQTGFTMLHDAMLQYFLVCKPGSEEANDFLEHLRPDPTLKEGEEPDNVDLLKNLAFTKPGSRLVSLALAYGSAKDRKIFLKPYKDTVDMMAYDGNAHHVLLAALALLDDTKLSSKSILGELLPANDTLPEKVLNIVSDVRARAVLLYPYAADAKWLIDDNTRERLSEVYAIRATTSKKDPNTRSHELAKSIQPQLLGAISARAGDFATFSYGLQFMGEVLVGAPEVEPERRQEALTEVASLTTQILDPSSSAPSRPKKGVKEDSEAATEAVAKEDTSAFGKNLLKTLVQGGKFDPKTKKVIPIDPPLGFADMFWDQIKNDVMTWATGQGSFVVLGLVESEDFDRKSEALKALKKGKKQLEAAAGPAPDKDAKKKGEKSDSPRGNAGARLLLEKL